MIIYASAFDIWMAEYLTMNITYDLGKDHYDVGGDLNEQGQREVLEAAIRSQLGAGRDDAKPNESDVFHINVKWRPEDDGIVIESDTGNKSLTCGLLMDLLRRLE